MVHFEDWLGHSQRKIFLAALDMADLRRRRTERREGASSIVMAQSLCRRREKLIEFTQLTFR
jgi:hypothetical protein